MPELPDIETYLSCLAPRILGQPLERARVRHFFLVFHLMIAGRFRWRPAGAKVPGKFGLAAFDFPTGTLLMTEAGTKKRASLHVVRGEAALAAHDPGGLEVLSADLDAFRTALTRESHTVKRALTDPRLLSGIGNAFSDEILHRARLSPFVLTGKLDGEATERLWSAARAVLTEWTERLRAEVGDGFPEKVTAFRDGFAVHGRHGHPCPSCQTEGRILADRSLSRLLEDDWPRSIDDL